VLADVDGSGYPGIRFTAANLGTVAAQTLLITVVWYDAAGAEVASGEATWQQLIEPGQSLSQSWTEQDEMPATAASCQIPQWSDQPGRA
jgi:cell division inhibitor SulA